MREIINKPSNLHQNYQAGLPHDYQENYSEIVQTQLLLYNHLPGKALVLKIINEGRSPAVVILNSKTW